MARPGIVGARFGSTSRRLGVVLKALAELGLSVPGSAEPQLGVERGETHTFIAGPTAQWGAAIGCASIEVESPGLLLPGLTLEDMNLRVKQLLDLDFIERTILQKANSRLQRYRLTARGRMRRI